jgi:hypothetical protein
MSIFHDVFRGDYAILELFADFMGEVGVGLLILYILICARAKDFVIVGDRWKWYICV